MCVGHHVLFWPQRERKEAKKKEKGGPFKLSSHPKDVFDENPYHSKKCK